MPVKNDREYRFFSDVKIEQKAEGDAAKRILIKGNAEVSLEASNVFAASEILLLGNGSTA